MIFFFTGWKSDRAKIICIMLCYISAKPILKVIKKTFKWSYIHLNYFCWVEVLQKCLFFLFSITVLILFVHSNHWCLHFMRPNPVCFWQTFNYDHLSIRTAGLSDVYSFMYPNIEEYGNVTDLLHLQFVVVSFYECDVLLTCVCQWQNKWIVRSDWPL